MKDIIERVNLEWLIFLAGVVHFGILIASSLVPSVLNWRGELAKLDRLTRQLIWVHGAFIVLVIIGFGLLAVGFAQELAAGGPLARGCCGLIGVFWGARLIVQWTVFDAREYLKSRLLKIGYHGLTVAFVYLTAVFGWAAIVG